MSLKVPWHKAKYGDPIRDDFRNFLHLVWKHLNLPEPTKLQYSMARWMQFCPERAMVKAFRGAAKSWITAAFVLWCLLRNPNLNILVFSASKSRSDGFTTFCLRLINEMPILAHLRPRDGQRCSMVAFDVGPAGASQTPSVMSIGIGGQATGHRGDLIVADDVEVPNNSETVLMREKLAERTKEFEYLLKPDGKIVFLGTDQVEDSVYGDLPDRGYTVCIWPVRYPADAGRYLGMLSEDLANDLRKDPALAGRPTEPTRFPDKLLVEREMSVGRREFDRQYMLDPSGASEEIYPLRLSDLSVIPCLDDVAPERVAHVTDKDHVMSDLPCPGLRGDRWLRGMIVEGTRYLPYQAVLMYVDPSGRGADETGYAVVGALNGFLYLLDCGGLRGYEEETLVALAETAKRWKVRKIVVEPNFGDGMFNRLLSPILNRIYPCTLEDDEHASTQKEKRIIATLEPVMANHKLVVSQALVDRDFESTTDLPVETGFRYRAFYQMSHITSVKGCLKHDDRLDAIAGAVRCLQKFAGVDSTLAIRKQREEEHDRELKKFIDSYYKSAAGFGKGTPPRQGRNWTEKFSTVPASFERPRG